MLFSGASPSLRPDAATPPRRGRQRVDVPVGAGGCGPAVGPIELLLVRNAESVGNVARDQRDADVPLSHLGHDQARAFGRWLAGLAPDRRPTSVWCSPYARARQTAEIALRQVDLELPMEVDERLRARELGVLDLLTARGDATGFPKRSIVGAGWASSTIGHPVGSRGQT